MDNVNDSVTIDEASRQAGIPASTLGYWIVAGVLEAKNTRQGRMVRMTEVRRAAGQLDTVVASAPASAKTSSLAAAPRRDAAWITLLNRILDLERDVVRVQALIARQADDVKRLDVENARARDRAGRVDLSLAEQVGRTNAALTDAGHRLERLDSAITEHTRELGRLDGALQEHSSSLGRFEVRVARHDELLARLEALLSEQAEAIRRLEQRPQVVMAPPVAPPVAAPSVQTPPPSTVIAAPDRKPVDGRPALVLRLRSTQDAELSEPERPTTTFNRPPNVAATAVPGASAAEGPRVRRGRWPLLNRTPARNSSVRS